MLFLAARRPLTQIEIALFFHLLGAMVFVGGVLVAGVAHEAARRRSDPAEVALLLGLARLGVVLVGFGGLAVLVFGLWLVDLTDAGFGARWVLLALGLFALSALLGALGGRRPKRARVLATQLARERSPATEELAGLLDDRLSRLANFAAAGLVVAILALMVWQPA